MQEGFWMTDDFVDLHHRDPRHVCVYRNDLYVLCLEKHNDMFMKIPLALHFILRPKAFNPREIGSFCANICLIIH